MEDRDSGPKLDRGKLTGLKGYSTSRGNDRHTGLYLLAGCKSESCMREDARMSRQPPPRWIVIGQSINQ